MSVEVFIKLKGLKFPLKNLSSFDSNINQKRYEATLQ